MTICISQLSFGYVVVTNNPNISGAYNNKYVFLTLSPCENLGWKSSAYWGYAFLMADREEQMIKSKSEVCYNLYPYLSLNLSCSHLILPMTKQVMAPSPISREWRSMLQP